MNDTSPEMAAKWRELLMQRSGAERVVMGGEVFSMARRIMTASLEAQGYQGMELRRYGIEEADFPAYLWNRFYPGSARQNLSGVV